MTQMKTQSPTTPIPSPNQIAVKQQGSQPPTESQIAARAYEKFVASGRQEGMCARNWGEAETELRQQAAAPGGTDKATAAQQADMASEGGGGAVGDSSHSGAMAKPSVVVPGSGQQVSGASPRR